MPGKYDVPYMQRTRDFYRAQGYDKDYVWAHHDETPFTPLPKPMRECRLGLITTAMPDTVEGRAKRQVYASMSTPTPESMYTDELSWQKTVTHTRDLGSFLPLNHLRNTARAGVLESLSGRFYSVPTEYSKRNTTEKDAPRILELCREDHIDVAMLVPL